MIKCPVRRRDFSRANPGGRRREIDHITPSSVRNGYPRTIFVW